MNDAEFELLEQIEEGHWWFVGKRLLLASLLAEAEAGARLLDLGCGTGGVLRDWSQRCRCFGVDGSRVALRICRRKGFESVAQGDFTALPFARGIFDMVVMLDVLEHLDDEVALLHQAREACSRGGRLLIAVPAFEWLWSQHDETFGHRRRYTASRLQRVVRSAGLVPERTTYTNALVFPLAAVWRLLSYRTRLGRFAPGHDFWTLPGWLNALLIRLYALEAWLVRRIDLPVGVSIVCIARPSED
jgi:SAM-dependent methyltransferase